MSNVSVFAEVKLFREFLGRPSKRGPSSNITTSQFAGTSIADHSELVLGHFQQYPILHIDLKVNWFVSISKGSHTYLLVQGCPGDHILRNAKLF